MGKKWYRQQQARQQQPQAETPFEPGKAEVTFPGPGVYPIEQLEVAPTPAQPQPPPPPPGLTTHKGAGSYYPKS